MGKGLNYSPCPKSPSSNDSHQSLLEHERIPPWEAQKTQRRRWWLTLLFSNLLIAGVTYMLTGLVHGFICRDDERVSAWMSSIDRSYHIELGNQAIAGQDDSVNWSWNNFTISTDIGGDGIEDWWLDLGVYTKPVLVPEKHAKDFGFDPQKHVLIQADDPYYEPGEVPYTGYPASIEVMHKLHCLNLLRQATYYNHQFYRDVHGKPWAIDEYNLVRHIGHCVDIFRQHIMCESEISLVPFINDEHEHRRNDWSMPRRCRNFASVRSWLADHQWGPGDPDFYLDDHHHFEGGRPTVTKIPVHTFDQLWRGA